MKHENFLVFTVLMMVTGFLLVGSFFVYTQSLAAQGDSGSSAQSQPFVEGMTVFGYSEEGRMITGYTFGSGEDTLFLVAGIHGNEKGGSALLQRLAEELHASPELISPYKKVVILPIANPDGYYTREDKLNANAVNLNRNFATTEWVEYGDRVFAGHEPFSEVESRLIKSLIESSEPNMMISFHSQGAIVSPEDGKNSINLAKWYADKTGYEYYSEWDYAGTATRWFTETTGNPSITIELINHVESDWAINKDALLDLISW